MRLLNSSACVSASVACLLLALAPRPASGFLAEEHRKLTLFAIDLLGEINPEAYGRLQDLNGCDPRIRDMVYENISYAPPRPGPEAGLAEKLAWEALAPDFFADLEFVDVDFEKDDPHEGAVLENSDEAGYSTRVDLLVGTVELILGMEHNNFTAFNHFINIGSYGKSLFDDYDGYSYRFILEHGRQCQKDGRLMGAALDGGILWYYNDAYVHAPGMAWYQGCSPAVERYSFPRADSTGGKELLARFPLAVSEGREGCGIPYSVFFPLDNLSMFWYAAFLETSDPLDLGPVMHAIGDAAIPHHAAGYLGNWHQAYELEIRGYVTAFTASARCRREAVALVEKWEMSGTDDPGSLSPDQWSMQPSSKWSVENLVTWAALNSYRWYVERYEPYYMAKGDGFIFEDLARESIVTAAAVKVLALKKAAFEVRPAE